MSVIHALAHKFSKQGTFRKVTVNFSWLLSQRILLLVVSMFVGIFVARSLGPTNYGTLNFALSFVALFSGFSELGITYVLVRELVKHEELHHELMGTSFVLKLVGFIFTFLLVFFGSHIIDTKADARTLMYIVAFGSVFTSFRSLKYYFQSQILSKYEAIARTTALIAGSSMKVLLVVLAVPLVYFAFAYMLSNVIEAITMIYFYQKRGGKIFHWKFNKKLAGSLLRDCWPVLLSGLVVTIHMKIDQIMIHQMLGSKEVGYYAAAAKLSEVWYFIPAIIVSSVYPILIKYKQRSEQLFIRQLRKLYDLMVVLALSVAIPITLLSDWIVHVIYGDAYVKTAGVLIVHIWAGVFLFMGVVRGKWGIIENQQRYNPIIQVGGAVVNILLNFMLIPVYGVMGAAIATLATVAANLLLTPVFINAKYRGQVRLILGSLNIFMLIPRLITYSKEISSFKEVK